MITILVGMISVIILGFIISVCVAYEEVINAFLNLIFIIVLTFGMSYIVGSCVMVMFK